MRLSSEHRRRALPVEERNDEATLRSRQSLSRSWTETWEPLDVRWTTRYPEPQANVAAF